MLQFVPMTAPDQHSGCRVDVAALGEQSSRLALDARTLLGGQSRFGAQE